MKHLSRLLFFLLLVAPAAFAQGYIHGNGDPRVTGVDCGRSRFYIDDTTSVMYVAGPGSPCVWTPAGSGAYPGVAADGSNGLAVSGTVAAGTTVSAPQHCIGSSCITAWPSGGQTTVLAPVSMSWYGDSNSTTFVVLSSQIAANRIANLLNIAPANYVNHAVSGAMIADVVQLQQFPNDVPTAAAAPPFIGAMIGINDFRIGNVGAYEANFLKFYGAMIVRATVPTSSTVAGSTANTTGTCANDTTFGTAITGEKCTVSGSTLSYSITTGGGPIYILARYIDTDTGAYTYSIDGGTAVAVTTALTPAINTANGTHASVGLIRVPVSAGSHTVLFTQTANGTMAITALATPPAPIASAPYIVIDKIAPMLNGANASGIAAYNADIMTVYNQLKGDGLNIIIGTTDTGVASTTAAADINNGDGLGLHFNATGQGEIVTATMANVRIVPSGFTVPATLFAGAWTGNHTGNYTLTGNDSWVLFGASSTATLTLTGGTPAPVQGQQFTVTNYGTASLTVSCGTATCQGVTLSMPANSSQTIIYFSSGFIYGGPVSGVPASSAMVLNGTGQNTNSNYTLASGVSFVYAFGASQTITLPANNVLPTGQTTTIANTGSSTVTIAGNQNGIPSSLAPGTAITIYYENASPSLAWFPTAFFSPSPSATVVNGAGVNTSGNYTLASGVSFVYAFGASQTITLPGQNVLPTGQTTAIVNTGTANVTIAVTGNNNNIPTSLAPGCAVNLYYENASSTIVWFPESYWCPTKGVATLVSGTVTVSNVAACAAGSGCAYHFDNCGVNGSTAIGVPSLGTVTAGTSFVINSESATATVVTGDTSKICWSIN